MKKAMKELTEEQQKIIADKMAKKELSAFKKKHMEERKEYDLLVKKYEPKSLRFFYFMVSDDSDDCCCFEPKYLGAVTLITVLSDDRTLLKIGVSFCDKRDTFCRWKGKLEVLRRFEKCDMQYTTTVPWSGDSLMDAVKFYNSIEKPVLFDRTNIVARFDLVLDPK